MGTNLNNCSILVAEDDDGDRLLMRKALKDSGIPNEVEFLVDGQALVDHLNRAPSGGGKGELPCLILMDLNMPRMDGREALRILKGDARLREIPVVVLTSSRNPQDVEGSYRDGANSFFSKPMEYKGLVDLMGLLKTYWLQAARLPHGEN